MVTHPFNPNTEKAEIGRPKVKSSLHYSKLQAALGYTGLLTLFQKKSKPETGKQ